MWWRYLNTGADFIQSWTSQGDHGYDLKDFEEDDQRQCQATISTFALRGGKQVKTCQFSRQPGQDSNRMPRPPKKGLTNPQRYRTSAWLTNWDLILSRNNGQCQCNSVHTVTRLRTGQPGFSSRQRYGSSFSTTVATTTLGLKPPSYPMSISPESKVGSFPTSESARE